MTVLNIVLPVFLVIALGWGLRRGGFLTAESNGVLTRLVYWVAAPALLARSAATTPLRDSVNPLAFGVMTAVTIGMALVVYAACWRSAPSRRGVIAQGSFRSNQVFLGLPLVYYAWGDEAVGQVSVVVGLMVILYNTLSVPMLTLPHRKHGVDPWRAFLDAMRRIVTNPLAVGTVVGIALSASGLPQPRALDVSLELVGRTALPLALISVGAALDLRRLKSELGMTTVVAMLKLVVYPALIWMGVRWAGVDGLALKAVVLIAATPTAVVSYVMAREMDGDEQLAAALIIGTTLLALPSTIAWLLILGV
ncbi:MAG TPA: AEC family transporter [Candidatus Krumholzibacteria bacterium]|nr:AEC family transporter [Candidatus Krumholzibacteria bacterium]